MSITYSKGIMDQIKADPTKEPLTLDECREELHKGLWEQIENKNKREFSIMTGHRGYQMFQDIFKRTALLGLLEEMTNDFTAEEMISIKKMINSEDTENMRVAEVIIDVKLNSTQISIQNVGNISSSGS